jgi:hypothetical protein
MRLRIAPPVTPGWYWWRVKKERGERGVKESGGGDRWEGGMRTGKGCGDVFELGGRDMAAHDDQQELVLVCAFPRELLWMGRGRGELTVAPPSVASAFLGGIFDNTLIVYLNVCWRAWISW